MQDAKRQKRGMAGPQKKMAVPPQGVPSASRKRMGEIDFIRFVLSVLIVCYHLVPRLAAKFPEEGLYPAINARIGTMGGIGVICFFILSGLFFQLGREWERMSFAGFAAKKAARLWPVLAFSLIINFHSEADVLNLFFISCGMGVIQRGSSNPASWYACVLFWLWLVFFLWFRRNFEAPTLRVGGTTATLLSLLIPLFSLIAHRETTLYSAIASPYIPFLTNGVLTGVTGFSIGVLLGRLKGELKIKNSYLVFMIQAGLLGYFLYLSVFRVEREEMAYYILIFTILVYFIVFQDGLPAISNSACLKQMGAWSYSIYILQFPCFYYYDMLIDNGILQVSPMAYVVIGTLACLLCGIAAHYLIERPAYRLYIRWAESRASARS